MSAWRVHTRHIDFVVTALLASDGLVKALPRSVDPAGRSVVDPTAIGRELLEENYASVDARYREHEPRPDYVYQRLELPNLATREGLTYALNAVGSYDYQSCEHDGWEHSRARAWVAALYSGLEEALELRGGRDAGAIKGWTVGADYSPALAHEDAGTTVK